MNAIEVRDVTKVYRLYNKPVDRLLEALGPKNKSRHQDFYALKGVSFNVEKGTTVGVIGTNGSGKSTILKIITGVLTPTTGTVEVKGTVSALLELGAGFNMEYSGIENIYMNGTMITFVSNWSAPFGISVVYDMVAALLVLTTSIVMFFVIIYSFQSIGYEREKY